MRKGGSAIKAGVWYTISNFIVKIASFITMPIFARLLSTSEIGAFSNITSWVTILAIVTTIDLFSSVTIAQFDFEDEINEYIASNLILGSLITGVCYLLSIIFKTQVTKWLCIDEATLHIIFIYLIVYPAVQMFQIKSRIFYKYKASVIVSVVTVFASLGGSLICVLLMKDRLFGRIIGYFAPLIIINLFIYMLLMYEAKKVSWKYWKYALAVSFPLIWHTLAGVLLSSCDRIIITSIRGASENGLYSIAYSCAIIVSVLWTSMNTAWSPWAYDMMHEKNYEALKKASKPYILVFLFVALNFMLLAPEVLLVIGGGAYINAKYVIPPVMAGYVFQFIYSLYVNIEFYHKKQVLIATGTCLAALANIILNYLFIPKYGYVAASYTTLAGYILLFLFHYIIVRNMKLTFYYDSKFNFEILLGSLITTMLMNVFYSSSIIRYFIFIIEILLVLRMLYIIRVDIIEAIKTKNGRLIFNAMKKMIIKEKE